MQCAARTLAPCAPAGTGRGLTSALVAISASVLLWLAAPAAAADRIAVGNAQLSLVIEGGEPGVTLDADFEFELPYVLEDAVNRGIALYFVVDFELYRERWYWFDRQLAQRTLTYRLTYSALTRQYRLARGSLALPFDSLAEALASLRRVRGWRVLERGTLKPDEDYRAQLRMRLDTGQLPKPFQINALTNRDWTLASDWRNVAVSADLSK
jgi:hypothetical protein